MPPQRNLQPKPPGLNVIALVSGGKDSLYSILHCIRNGHTVVALANLYPKPSNDGPGGDDDEEDTDSFMYQTIGHSVIPLYEAALGIPLYRGHITGGAVDTSRVYRDRASTWSDEKQDQDSGQDQDETESLTPLLKRVMANHPEANAVSAGAILSTYQRTRIENVAGRLGLTPLAWLWMYPSLPAPVQRRDGSGAADAGLLEDMAAVGCEARIIKVASGGLDEGVLWEDVSGPGPGVRGKLVKAMKRFCAPEDTRGAVLGEGGEYESLALDGPGFLWEKRIVIDEREGKTGEGGVGFMRLRGAKCVVKEKEEGVEDVTPEDVRRPALLDGVFGEVLDGLLAVPIEGEGGLSTALNPGPEKQWLHCEPIQTKHAGIWTISNLTAPEAGPDSGAQMQTITGKVKTILSSPSSDVIRSTDDIVFATVLLRSMADFTHMNNIYNTLFRKPNPPARVTIACGETLPEGVNIMVSFVVDLGARESRQGLHVQSRSYWAPANIGPYSQAMSIPLQGAGKLVYIAGQIPLEPASMELVSPALASVSASESLVTEQPEWMAEYALRTVLALQHLWRIGATMQVVWWVGAVAYLTGEDDGHVDAKARIAWRLWEKMHTKTDNDDDEEDEDEEPFDAWDLKYGHRAYGQLSSSAETPSLPNFTVLRQSSNTVPPFFAVQAAELPRGSDIEWQGLGSHCDQVVISPGTTGTTTTTIDKNLHYTGVEISIEQSDSELEACLQKVLEMHGQQNASQVVVYTAQTLSPGFVWPGQIVPCRGVWGMQGRRLRAGVVIQSVV